MVGLKVQVKLESLLMTLISLMIRSISQYVPSLRCFVNVSIRLLSSTEAVKSTKLTSSANLSASALAPACLL